MDAVLFIPHGVTANTAVTLARKLPSFSLFFSPGELPCSSLCPSQALLLGEQVDILYYTSVMGVEDVSRHIRRFLDTNNFSSMQESEIHTSVCHLPEGNVYNQTRSCCYWVINQDTMGH